MKRRLKWLLALPVVVLLALLAYVAAGPWLAMNGLRQTVASDNTAELWRFVDFDQLRASLSPQIRERIALDMLKRTGPTLSPQKIAEVTELISPKLIDRLASPEAIDRLLSGDILTAAQPAAVAAAAAAGPNADPLGNARTHFESTSLFTATVDTPQGQQVVFEFRRSGLNWKLTGLRLPKS